MVLAPILIKEAVFVSAFGVCASELYNARPYGLLAELSNVDQQLLLAPGKTVDIFSYGM